MKPVITFFLMCVVLAMLTACSTTGTVAPGQPVGNLNLKPGTQIIILEPKLQYERAGTEFPIDGGAHGAREIAADLTSSALSALREKGFAATLAKDFQPDVTHSLSLAEQLSSSSGELLRGFKPVQLMQELQTYGGTNLCTAVLVQHFKIKVGPEATWDPNSGAITSAMHSGLLRAALLDCQNGSVLWKNQTYLREVPNLKSKNYRKAVDSIYQPATNK